MRSPGPPESPLHSQRFRHPDGFIFAEHAACNPVPVTAGTPAELVPPIGRGVPRLPAPGEANRLRGTGEVRLLPVGGRSGDGAAAGTRDRRDLRPGRDVRYPRRFKVVSYLIRTEKEAGNEVYVNMSSCGRKTSVAVTRAAMVHEAPLYYVGADRYATGDGEECEHGLSIVENVRPEVFQPFRIMMPRPEHVRLLVELFRRKEAGAGGMTSEEIIEFFHGAGVHGYENLHTAERDGYVRAGKKRALLNRTNRGHLKELEEQGYVAREWRGRNFSIRITQAGEHIACVSGLVPCT